VDTGSGYSVICINANTYQTWNLKYEYSHPQSRRDDPTRDLTYWFKGLGINS